MRHLFDKYGSDKGSKHHYETIYERDFEKLRSEPINLLEIGIYKGNSISVWLDYFPKATVYAIDIFERVLPDSIPVLSHPRVKWETCDSVSRSAKDLWSDVKFDIIIDDGMHNSIYNRRTFLNFIDKLKSGGSYYVEDVIQHNIITPTDRLPGSYSQTLNNQWYLHNGKLDDYNLMLNTFRTNCKSMFIYDNRELSNYIDSCVIKIKK